MYIGEYRVECILVNTGLNVYWSPHNVTAILVLFLLANSPASEFYVLTFRNTVSGVPRNFVRGGSTNSVEDRENGDLGAVAPYSGVLEAAVIW